MFAKRIFLFVMLSFFSQMSFAQKVADDDPLGFYLSSSYGLCIKKTSICPGDSEKLRKYEGKRGRFISLTPDFTEYSSHVYQVKMEDGRVLYYNTKRDTPFYENSTIKLTKHLETLGLAGESIVDGSGFKVDKVFHNGTGYKFVLSTGYEMYGDEFQILRLLLQSIPIEYEAVLFENLSNLRLSHDKLEDIFFLSPRDEYSSNNSDALALMPYVGVRGSEAWLRFKVYYKSSSWLFVGRFLVKADDFRREFKSVKFDRDHSSGSIWEWYDRPALSSDIELLGKVVGSDDAVVRFYGSKYYADRVITSKQKEKIGSVLSVYEVFKNFN